LTPGGLAALKQRQRITLTKPIAPPEPGARAPRAGEISCDEALFERLRQVRKRLADERDVPAYVIFSDVSLRQMARQYPANERDFARISGVGAQKLAQCGAVFLQEIAEHLRTNPRQVFAGDLDVFAPAKPWLNESIRETLRLFQAGANVEQIARQRGLATSTIYGHLATAIEAGEAVELDRLLSPEEQQQLAAAFARAGFGNLTGAKELLGERFDYGQLRLYRAAKAKSRPPDPSP
jgi:ATP-dependent DNA helicase RecQ